MAKVDLARRAEIGRERRSKTRAVILSAGAMLLAECPAEALTVDAVVDAAGVAKGTFYYHFQGIGDLAAAVGAMMAESFDDILVSSRLERHDPIERLSFAFQQFLEKGIREPAWARLVIQSWHSPTEYGRGIRDHLKADLEDAISGGRLVMQDADLAADVVMGIWLQVTRSMLERGPAQDLPNAALGAVLRDRRNPNTGSSAKSARLDIR